MATYSNDAEAAAAGYTVSHLPEQHRFVLSHEGREIGTAHYTLAGSEDGSGFIDFDHTFVTPDLRGTGLSGVLARQALTHEIVRGRTVHTSCWFIEEFLLKHPELLDG